MGLFDRFFGPPSKDKFAKMVLAGIRRSGETRKVTYDRDQYRLVVEGKEGEMAYLGNAYQEYCAVPKDLRPEILRKYVRTWFSRAKEPPACYEDVRPDLLPALRSRSYFELTRLRMKLEGHEMADCPHQILGEHFALGLVYDLPESMRSISQEDLEVAGGLMEPLDMYPVRYRVHDFPSLEQLAAMGAG